MKPFLFFYSISLILSFSYSALAQRKVEFDYFGTDPHGEKAPNVRVHCGDEVQVTATGQIKVGFLARERTPAGLPVYSDNQYNIFKDKPHCALMVCAVEPDYKISEANFPYLGWEVCGVSYTYKVQKDGYLLFALNEKTNWYWDNTPIGRGFHVTVTVPDRKNTTLGILKDKEVYRKNDKVIYQCKQFERDNDGYWYIKDEATREIIGICSDQKPYLYTHIGENKRTLTDNDVYADLETKTAIIYKKKKLTKSTIDNRWYLKDSQGICEGIVDLTNEGNFSIHPDDNELTSLLKHLNRNLQNREAKGALRYLCTRAGGSFTSRTFSPCTDKEFRLYYDENNCIWALAESAESIYHNGWLKFTRLDPVNSNASFESIRIPSAGEGRQSAIIIGQSTPYKVNDRAYSSVNLRDTQWRGSYNFAHSSCFEGSYSLYQNHKEMDIKPHEDGYKDYMIFAEQFGVQTIQESTFRLQALQVPLTNQQRTCPN